ncbi:MAG: hypothetical protein V1849_03660 [Chloroflexota bacterium]
MPNYPAPRYPRFARPKSVEELMPKARELLNAPPTDRSKIASGSSFFKPGYDIKPGDKILFVVLSEYDPMVVEAMRRAMKEKGATVDLLTLDSSPIAPPEELAVHEAIAMGKEEEDYSYYYTLICDLLRTTTAKAMVELEKYSFIIAGQAGPAVPVDFPWFRFNFPELEDFAGPVIDMPVELLEAIDQKGWAQIMSCEVMHLTDPEGTDVKWTNYKDGRRFAPQHLLARPYYIGIGFGGKDDCIGVMGGTLNHMGAFPHIKAYLEGGQVVRLEGGGKYGDVWREKLEKYRKVKLPPLPFKRSSTPQSPHYQINDPGLFWFFECAIGTVPTVTRTTREGRFENYANILHDRKRSGYIHCGFGPPTMSFEGMIRAGLPWVHTHIHLMFATLTGKTKDGKNVTIIDKGHLTALDDPEVRRLASKYADPDKLLNEIWIPGVPGINLPGDYLRDYGRDPVSWIRKEAAEHPIWID